MTGDEIGVEMGEEHVLDRAPRLRGVLEILLDVPLRIDDRRAPVRLIGDEVRRMREAAEVVLLEDHRAAPIDATFSIAQV